MSNRTPKSDRQGHEPLARPRQTDILPCNRAFVLKHGELVEVGGTRRYVVQPGLEGESSVITRIDEGREFQMLAETTVPIVQAISTAASSPTGFAARIKESAAQAVTRANHVAEGLPADLDLLAEQPLIAQSRETTARIRSALLMRRIEEARTRSELLRRQIGNPDTAVRAFLAKSFDQEALQRVAAEFAAEAFHARGAESDNDKSGE